MVYIGIDVGTKFIGTAIGDSDEKIASPWITIKFNQNNFIQAVSILKNKLDYLGYNLNNITFVIGWPVNINNSTNKATRMVDNFIDKLKVQFESTKIVMQNEMYSTKQAKEMLYDMDLKASIRDKNVDRISASIILQAFFNEKNN